MSCLLLRDPVMDGSNWYGYCSNNPLKYVDPTGLNDTPPEIQKFLESKGVDMEAAQKSATAARTTTTGKTNSLLEPVDIMSVDWESVAQLSYQGGLVSDSVNGRMNQEERNSKALASAMVMAIAMAPVAFEGGAAASAISTDLFFKLPPAAQFILSGGAVGSLFQRAASKGVSQIPGFVEHGAQRAAERGFTPERIAQVIQEGKPIEAMGRYGTQIRYTLGNNTVVVATEGRNAGLIISTFSDQVVNGINGYWVKP